MLIGQRLWCCSGFGIRLDGEICASMPGLLSGLFCIYIFIANPGLSDDM